MLTLEGLEGLARASREATVAGSCGWLERQLTERCEAFAAFDDVTFLMIDWQASGER